MTRFYSQNGEDALLWEFFDHQKTGFYVDVGAFDGVHLSNTKWYEDMGWDGICIEAHPTTFTFCEKNRPNSRCIHAACVGDSSQTTITFQAEPLGLYSGIATDNDLSHQYEVRGMAFSGFETVTVPTITLNKALITHPTPPTHIDFLSIDVEGAEIDVLAGFDMAKYAPRVLVMEANTPQDEATLTAYLADKGYIMARRVAENLYFVKTTADAKRLRQISVTYTDPPTFHPLGEAYTNPLYANPRQIIIPSESANRSLKTLVKRIIGKQ